MNQVTVSFPAMAWVIIGMRHRIVFRLLVGAPRWRISTERLGMRTGMLVPRRLPTAMLFRSSSFLLFRIISCVVQKSGSGTFGEARAMRAQAQKARHIFA